MNDSTLAAVTVLILFIVLTAVVILSLCVIETLGSFVKMFKLRKKSL